MHRDVRFALAHMIRVGKGDATLFSAFPLGDRVRSIVVLYKPAEHPNARASDLGFHGF